MKKSVVIILSVLLAIALIVLVLLYHRYADRKAALLTYEEQLSELNQKIIKMTGENTDLRGQILADAEKLKKLEQARHQISALENAAETLSDRAASSNRIIAELQNRIKNFQTISSERNKLIQKKDDEIKLLRSRVSDIESEKDAADKLINQLKSDHEIAVLELNQKIKTRHKKEAEHLKQLEAANAEIQNIRRKATANQEKIAGLGSQLSDCKEKKDAADKLISQLKSDHKIAVAALNQEIAEKNSGITALEKQLEKSRSETIAFIDETKTQKSRIKYLEERISTLFGEKELLKSRMDQLKSSYTSMTSDLKNQILKKEVTIDELEGKLRITFVNRILFEFGKAAISSQGKNILTKVGKNLKELRNKKIRVIGHTDSIPIMEKYRYKFPSNWELSAARSAAVVRFLQTKIGINPRNLEAVGRSLYDPIAPNTTKKGRAKNRRVNIIVAPLIE